jgi:hypothetical protein
MGLLLTRRGKLGDRGFCCVLCVHVAVERVLETERAGLSRGKAGSKKGNLEVADNDILAAAVGVVLALGITANHNGNGARDLGRRQVDVLCTPT